MTEERKADVEARLDDLEYEIALAIRQGAMDEKFQWMTTFSGRAQPGKPEESWIAVLSVGKT